MYTPNPASLQGTLHDSRFEHDACGIGFVAHVKGHPSNAILRQALTVLNNLKHRGATGCEPNTGDGAGISIQTPHRFLARVAAEAGIELPPPGHYAVGMVFLPPDPAARRQCEARLEEIIREESQFVLGWRTVPTDNSALGATARAREPVIRQVFVGWKPDARSWKLEAGNSNSEVSASSFAPAVSSFELLVSAFDLPAPSIQLLASSFASPSPSFAPRYPASSFS